jgi:hypothetical protein
MKSYVGIYVYLYVAYKFRQYLFNSENKFHRWRMQFILFKLEIDIRYSDSLW